MNTLFSTLFVAFVLISCATAKNWFGPSVLKKHSKDSNKTEVIPSCHMTPAYPPPSERALESFIINLDLPPDQRWTEPTNKYMTDIQNVIDLTIGSKIMIPFREMVDKVGVNNLLNRLPNDWGLEIIALSNQLKRSKTDLLLFNLAYSLMGFCTSIIAQDTDYNLYHGRNLDFGLWPAVNWSDWQWDLTTDLKKVVYIANFTKNNGEYFYQSVTYGGFIGLHTGIKKGVLSLSIDTRFDNNYDKYLIDWINNNNDTNQLLVMTTRYLIETYDNYNDALNYLAKNVSFVCPAYIIMGGLNKNEGNVLTYGPNSTLFDQWSINQALPMNNSYQSPFYVLETNYDHWNQPPWYDDRRYPAELCMDEIGSKGMSFYTMYNVLNGIPNRNRLTTFTALMNVKTGDFEAYKQYCDVPECIPW